MGMFDFLKNKGKPPALTAEQVDLGRLQEQAKTHIETAWQGQQAWWGNSWKFQEDAANECFEQRMLMCDLAWRYLADREYSRTCLTETERTLTTKGQLQRDNGVRSSREEIDAKEVAQLDDRARWLAKANRYGLRVFVPEGGRFSERGAKFIRLSTYFHALVDTPQPNNTAQLFSLGQKDVNQFLQEVEKLATQLSAHDERQCDLPICLGRSAYQRIHAMKNLLRPSSTATPEQLQCFLEAMQYSQRGLRKLLDTDDQRNIRFQALAQGLGPAFSRAQDPIELQEYLEGTHALAPFTEQFVSEWAPNLLEYGLDRNMPAFAGHAAGYLDLSTPEKRYEARPLLIRGLAQSFRQERATQARVALVGNRASTYRTVNMQRPGERSEYWRGLLEDDPLASVEAQARFLRTITLEEGREPLERIERDYEHLSQKMQLSLHAEQEESPVLGKDLLVCGAQIQLTRARFSPGTCSFADLHQLARWLEKSKINSCKDMDLSVEQYEAGWIMLRAMADA